MNPATKLAHAVRRIAAGSSIRMVRREDARRYELHGDGIGGLNARFSGFADQMEREARQFEEGDLG